MKLIYRGNTYNYNPVNVTARRPFQHTRTSDSAYELIYRGNTYRVEPTAIAKAPVKTEAYELIYRGNTYRVEPTAIAKAPVKTEAYELIYRGVTYWVNRNEQGEVTAMTLLTNPSKKASMTARPSTQQVAG